MASSARCFARRRASFFELEDFLLSALENWSDSLAFCLDILLLVGVVLKVGGVGKKFGSPAFCLEFLYSEDVLSVEM
jgi:hypothetical protein